MCRDTEATTSFKAAMSEAPSALVNITYISRTVKLLNETNGFIFLRFHLFIQMIKNLEKKEKLHKNTLSHFTQLLT